MLDPAIVKKAEELRPRYPDGRALMLPILRAVQARYGCVDLEKEAAVAELLQVPQVWVHEAVTFYTMISEKPIGKYHVQICNSVICHFHGAEQLIQRAQEQLGVGMGETTPDGVITLSAVECLCGCAEPVCVQINDRYYENLSEASFDQLLERMRAGEDLAGGEGFAWVDTSDRHEVVVTRNFRHKDAYKLDVYRRHGGYQAWMKVLRQMKPEEVIETVKRSNLRGRGGAGFPCGMKWGFVPRDTDRPKFICVNADESEPGTFKDRLILERDPHQLIEGACIAAYAVGASHVYIYMRGEFAFLEERVQGAIDEAYAAGLIGRDILGSGFSVDFTLHMGAGAYICGEETGLLSSLEGKKGFPRLKPPFPAVVGAFGCPTVINNVETLANVPYIFLKGPEHFAALGSEKNGGTKLYCVSGDVARPGVYELPMGTPLRTILNEYAGGVKGELQAVIPGGASAPILTADEIDVPMDFDGLAKIGSMLGSAGVMVLNRERCVVRTLYLLMHFFHHESCGQCTPCREGTGWAEKIVRGLMEGRGTVEDLDTLEFMARNMSRGMTICPLGDAAAMPMGSYVKKFRSVFVDHARCGGCRSHA